MPKSIKDFLTVKPETSNKPKTQRIKRSRSSPEFSEDTVKVKKPSFVRNLVKEMGGELEVGKMAMKDLLAQFSELIDSKELARKEDISELKLQIEDLQTENKSLKVAMEDLRTKNEVLENRIEYLENYTKRNNLLFFGLDSLNGSNQDIIIKFCGEVLGVEISLSDIVSIVSIGLPIKSKKIMKVTFVNNYLTGRILRNTKKLKGTGFYINKDFSYAVRQRRRMLFQFRKEIYQKDKNKRVFIRNDTLFMDDKAYYWDTREKCVKERVSRHSRLKIQSERGEDYSSFNPDASTPAEVNENK